MQAKRKSAIKQAASGAKLVGGLFVLAGGLPMLIAMADARGWLIQVAGVTTTLMLVGPGVWYIIASVFLARNQYWAISTTYKVALGQIVAVILAIVLSVTIQWGSRNTAYIIVPAILAVYFLPALTALLFDMRKAGRELEAIEGRGFAVEILPVIPVDADPPAQAGSPTQSQSLDA